MGSQRHRQSPPSHYRVWAAFRGLVYFAVLAIAVPLIPRTTPLGWVAALVVSALLATLGTRWLYAALTGRLGRSMREALDDDQTMGSV
jgi:membrane protein implicated in regulation of membrane protease activity